MRYEAVYKKISEILTRGSPVFSNYGPDEESFFKYVSLVEDLDFKEAKKEAYHWLQSIRFCDL